MWATSKTGFTYYVITSYSIHYTKLYEYFSPLNWIDSSTGAAPATGIVAIGVTLNRDMVIQNTVQPVGGSGIRNNFV